MSTRMVIPASPRLRRSDGSHRPGAPDTEQITSHEPFDSAYRGAWAGRRRTLGALVSPYWSDREHRQQAMTFEETVGQAIALL